MKALVLLMVAVVPLAACQADTKNLNDRMERIEKKIDALIAQGPRGAAPAAGAQRPQRPQPDRAATYAVPVDNAPIEGAANAKVTLVMATDYA